MSHLITKKEKIIRIVFIFIFAGISAILIYNLEYPYCIKHPLFELETDFFMSGNQLNIMFGANIALATPIILAIREIILHIRKKEIKRKESIITESFLM